MASRVLLLLIAVLLPWPGTADADVRRCQTPSGRVIYTDRTCDTLDAVEQLEPPRPLSGSASWVCARTVRDLITEVTTAIDSRNPDGLVRLYHWNGLSHDAGYRIADRLQALAERPLIGVVPVLPAVEEADGQALTTDRRPPVALRVQQMANDGDEVVVTTLGLHKDLGCWWLRL